jgi:hypothetical protein
MQAEARCKENPTSLDTYLQQLEISVRDLVEEGRPHPADISSHSYTQDEEQGDLEEDASSSIDLREEEGEPTSRVQRKRARAARTEDSSDQNGVSLRRVR